MKIQHIGTDTRFMFSANDTEKWAQSWPCSSLRGHRLSVTFDAHGDLVDASFDGHDVPMSVDGYELLCLVDTYAPKKSHPARLEA
jgi:hypothetical protein